jgi:predicted Zn-dependent peptidase
MVTLLQRQHHRFVLRNGMVLLAVENNAADIVAARCFCHGGAAVEPPQKAGLAHLTASVMTKGTAQHSSLDIAERVEAIGASLGTEANTDYFALSLKTITTDFAEMLHLGAQIWREPSFPMAELELERKLTLQGIRSQKERPLSVAYEKLQHLLYGNHPYSLPSLGTEATVRNLSQADLQQYHQTYLHPQQMVMSITGKITPLQAQAMVEEAFGDWHPEQPPIPLSITPRQFQPQAIFTQQPTQQAIIMLGYPAPSIYDPDYGAFKLINTYLGSGLSSRLFVELREKRGLAYEVSTIFPARRQSSQFVTYMGTAPHNALDALQGLKDECERLAAQPLSDHELDVAKGKLLGQYALGKQTNSQIAHVMGWYELLGLGVEFDQQFTEHLSQISADQIQQAAQKYFAAPVVSCLGSEVALSQLSSLGLDWKMS